MSTSISQRLMQLRADLRASEGQISDCWLFDLADVWYAVELADWLMNPEQHGIRYRVDYFEHTRVIMARFEADQAERSGQG